MLHACVKDHLTWNLKITLPVVPYIVMSSWRQLFKLTINATLLRGRKHLTHRYSKVYIVYSHLKCDGLCWELKSCSFLDRGSLHNMGGSSFRAKRLPFYNVAIISCSYSCCTLNTSSWKPQDLESLEPCSSSILAAPGMLQPQPGPSGFVVFRIRSLTYLVD